MNTVRVAPSAVPAVPIGARRHLAALAAAVLALGASTAASAQYLWKDAQGHPVYSDLPPPVTVPLDQIMRTPKSKVVAAPAALAPGGAGNGPGAANAAGAANAQNAGAANAQNAGAANARNAGAGTAPSLAQPGASAAGQTAALDAPDASIADRELAYRKRLAERADSERKAAEEDQHRRELAKACADARSNIRLMESGQRISRIAANGEREFLSDAERQQRLVADRKSIAERC
ncbi:MAG: DUF4124 domain-containing protein [Lautropia sp.]